MDMLRSPADIIGFLSNTMDMIFDFPSNNVLQYHVENFLLQHLDIFLSSDFLTSYHITSTQNKTTLMKYSTQINLAEEEKEAK
jgi:hypothetical protein